jgi:pimeloyl-ACP methyl ester carboxylesterase
MALLVLVVVAGLVALFLIPGSTREWTSAGTRTALPSLSRFDTQQWILIRSENAKNPVVLFVHGGPGTSWLTLMRKNTQPLEKYFTVVNWDQRRAGKSFAAGRVDDEMTMGAFVDDLIALSSELARRFHKNRILLVGHSWGSVIGVIAASRRPDLFSAPSVLSAKYFEALKAPRKELVWFERSAHLPNTRRRTSSTSS